MKFLWTTLAVKNMDESIAFYTNLVGLHVMNRFPAGPGMEITFMGNGIHDETLVELLADSTNRTVTYSDDISLGFAVDSVEAMLETVKRHHIPVHAGPVDTPSGSRFFCIKDPNGLTVQFFQQT